MSCIFSGNSILLLVLEFPGCMCEQGLRGGGRTEKQKDEGCAVSSFRSHISESSFLNVKDKCDVTSPSLKSYLRCQHLRNYGLLSSLEQLLFDSLFSSFFSGITVMHRASLVAQMVKTKQNNLLAMQETQVLSLCREGPLEKENGNSL